MTIDKQQLQKLLWAEAASYRADCADWKRNTEALDEFLGEKTVGEVALELLAENDRLKTLRSTTERDLAQELEVWRHGPSCWNCGDTGDVHDIVGEWRGKCDCFAAQLMDATQERDQLKAENEALRNGLRLARHWCASALKAARVDSQPSELLDIACLLRHQASDIDAAMGKGEQT
jgi:hypothetical protein